MYATWTLVLIFGSGMSTSVDLSNIFIDEKECVRVGKLLENKTNGNVKSFCYESKRINVK